MTRKPSIHFAISLALLTAGSSSCGGKSSDTTTAAVQVGTDDPIYSEQWHLKNTGQAGGTSGEDINVEPVWNSCSDSSCHGEGVAVAVIDSGVQAAHEDLRANLSLTLSHNYLNGGNDPTPTGTTGDAYTQADRAHGTACAGLVAARDSNGYGGRGAAPRATLVGYNYLENSTTTNESDSMTRNAASIGVSSNSWGPADGYGILENSTTTWRNAINVGLSSGRGGKGTVYVWAAGNGANGASDCLYCYDNSNYDGYANYRGVLAVGAVNDKGKKSSYSEKGSNLWISAPGGEYCNTHAITTTDLSSSAGFNPNLYPSYDMSNTNYTRCMNGTSSATPIAAGAIALVLQANPTLSWRDVRLVLAQSARKNDPTDSDWVTNGAGYHVNHKYGFGVIDASAAVTLAKTWSNVGSQLTYTTSTSNPGTSIPDNNTTGVSDSITVSGSGISSIEWVEITFSAANHTYSGDLEITLTNTTTGTASKLSEQHRCDSGTCVAYSGWIFSSSHHLGEAADGTWTLKVRDLASGDTGTFQSWSLKFYGR